MMGKCGGRGGAALLPVGLCLALTLTLWGVRLGGETVGVPQAQAATLTVCANGCDYTRIGDALSAANDGDTISVGAGTYPETLTITHSVTLIGTGVIAPLFDATVLDGKNSGTPIT